MKKNLFASNIPRLNPPQELEVGLHSGPSRSDMEYGTQLTRTQVGENEFTPNYFVNKKILKKICSFNYVLP